MAFVSGVALTRICWDCIGLVFLAAVAGVCTVGFLFQTPALKQTAQDTHTHGQTCHSALGSQIITKPNVLAYNLQTLYKGMLLVYFFFLRDALNIKLSAVDQHFSTGQKVQYKK